MITDRLTAAFRCDPACKPGAHQQGCRSAVADEAVAALDARDALIARLLAIPDEVWKTPYPPKTFISNYPAWQLAAIKRRHAAAVAEAGLS